MLVSRKWLQTYFEEELPEAQDLAETLMFHSFEIENVYQQGDDWIIDVDVLPNRSSDCLSHRGIARELATLLSQPLKREPFRESLPAYEKAATLTVEVDDQKLCPRYMGAVVRGVTVGPSPDWLKSALESIGQKSINNIVDAANYVMFDLGQPLHAFDLALIEKDKDNVRHIGVRTAKEDEQIVVLTGEEYTLSSGQLIITDAVSDAPLAIAGIKGGKRAEIGPETVDVVLEAANFNYVSVRTTSRSLKLATDASLRFQNEPAPELAGIAMRELIVLIEDVAGGKLLGVTDVYAEQGEHQPVDVSLAYINSLLGTTMTYADVEKILIRLEWEFSRDKDEFAVTPPWERTDLTSPAAMIEEIGRVYGYRNIAPVMPPVPENKPETNKFYDYSERIRHVLSDLGYSELYTYLLGDHGKIEIQNPLASDKAFMRMNLRDGLINALEFNASNAPFLGLESVRIFEIGTVFAEQGEHLALGIGVRAIRGKQGKLEEQLRRDVDELMHAIGVELKGKVEDGVYEIILDPVLTLAREHSSYNTPLPWDPSVRYAPWSQYPIALRDLAVWVPSTVDSGELLELIKNEASDLLIRADQFDTFEKEGRTSYAWHLVFQAPDRTLTDSEVNERMETLAKAITKNKDWEVR